MQHYRPSSSSKARLVSLVGARGFAPSCLTFARPSGSCSAAEAARKARSPSQRLECCCPPGRSMGSGPPGRARARRRAAFVAGAVDKVPDSGRAIDPCVAVPIPSASTSPVAQPSATSSCRVGASTPSWPSAGATPGRLKRPSRDSSWGARRSLADPFEIGPDDPTGAVVVVVEPRRRRCRRRPANV